MPKFINYVSGKGSADTNRLQLIQVLACLIQKEFDLNISEPYLNVQEVMDMLDASEEFAQALMHDLVLEDVAVWSTQYKDTIEYVTDIRT